MKTENEILEIAFLLFLEKGFSEVSTNELIRAAGLTKGGFYYSFKSRDDLDQQVVEKIYQTLFLSSDRGNAAGMGKKQSGNANGGTAVEGVFPAPALCELSEKIGKRLPFGISISCSMKGERNFRRWRNILRNSTKRRADCSMEFWKEDRKEGKSSKA